MIRSMFVLALFSLSSPYVAADCRQFLAEIKPYQIAYSSATTVLQQQAALTAIQIIQKQYQGEPCKFKLDAYTAEVRAAQLAQQRAVAADAAREERETQKRRENTNAYNKCMAATDPADRAAVDKCIAIFD